MTNNKQNKENFQPINSLMRQKLGIKKPGKLTLNETDNVFKIVQKLANFITNNSGEITNEEIELSFGLIYPEMEVQTISFEDSNLDLVVCNSRLKGFSKLFATKDDFRVFLGTIKEDQKGYTRLFMVSDNVPFKDHRSSWSNTNHFLGTYTDKLTLITLNKLIGLKRIYDVITSEYAKIMADYLKGEKIHPGFNPIDLVVAFESLFQNSKNGSKKLDYYYQNSDIHGFLKAYLFEEMEQFEALKAQYHLVTLYNEKKQSLTIKEGGTSWFISDTSRKDVQEGTRSTSWTKGYAFDFIKQTLISLYKDDLNVRLMNYYTEDNAAQYARAFETKKNIPEKVQLAMNSSRFLNNFSFVEFDESIDLFNMEKLETEWKNFSLYLPQPLNGNKAELRFRFLGRHHARGIFFPGINTIALDPREMSDGSLGVTSFVHEFGHFLDFNHTFERPLSLEADFFSILNYYQENFGRFAGPISNADYFKTPTEVFARSFEVYFDQFKNVVSSFNKIELTGFEYSPLQEQIPEIMDYFNQLFPGLKERLESFKIQTQKPIMNAKYIQRAMPNGSAASKIVEEVVFVEQLSLFDF